MQGSSKRENLEQTMRRRLVAEIRRLQEFNRDLRGLSLNLPTTAGDLLTSHTVWSNHLPSSRLAENLQNARTHVAKEVEAADHNQHIMKKLLEQSECWSGCVILLFSSPRSQIGLDLSIAWGPLVVAQGILNCGIPLA